MKFSASLDKFSKTITTAVTLLFLVLLYSQYQVWISTYQKWIPLAMGFFFIAVYALCYCLKPLGYEITHGELIISRYLGNVSIPRSDIQQVSLLSQESIKRSIRTFGNGGLFGYVGKFYNRTMGKMTWYITRRDSLVLVETKDGRKILLSPDEPEQFVNHMKY
jgi:hypothetical protein